MSITFTITTQDHTLTAEHAQSDPNELNNRTRGSTATFDFLIPLGTTTLTVASGDTYTVSAGTTEKYNNADIDGTLVIEDTAELVIFGTLDNDGTINNNGSLTLTSGTAGGFANLIDYDRHAGSYSLNETLNNTQRYKERLPSNANISSLVVGIEPAGELQNKEVQGKWGLISNVTDNRTRALTNPVLTLEIDILADYTEYSSVSDVQTNLGI
jgi:hypothetical protein